MVHLAPYTGDPPHPPPHGGDYGSGGSGYPPIPHSMVYGAPPPPHMLQGLKILSGFSALCLCCATLLQTLLRKAFRFFSGKV